MPTRVKRNFANSVKYGFAHNLKNTYNTVQIEKISGGHKDSYGTPKIMNENNDKFLRMTANNGDHYGTSGIRSTVSVTPVHQSMLPINNSNKHQSYSADVRFVDNLQRNSGASTNHFMEFFQGSDRSAGSSGPNSATGPAARFVRRENGHVYFEKTQNGSNGLQSRDYDLGSYGGANQFHNYKLDAIWSDDNNGAFRVYVDGQPKLNLERISTYYNPGKSNLLPEMKVGLYGGNAVGSVDMKNVQVNNLK